MDPNSYVISARAIALCRVLFDAAWLFQMRTGKLVRTQVKPCESPGARD